MCYVKKKKNNEKKKRKNRRERLYILCNYSVYN